jgi:hypothetical protein
MSAPVVYLRGQPVRLEDKDLLGTGGEAQVFEHAGQALKVFHPIPAGLVGRERALQVVLLELKREKLACFPRTLPAGVVAPQELLLDHDGAVVGYTMPKVAGAEEVRMLANKRFREGVLTDDDVLTLFERLHDQLTALHAAGVVAGDLNDGNVLFRGLEPFLIDADSMQFGPYPCPVGHERTLDPQLYGVDLLAQPSFTELSDWYAFDVLLFSSLLYVHPYGGVASRYPTLLRRAEASHSLLRDDVILPRAATMPQALTDDLLDRFHQTFDESRRVPFDRKLLDVTFTVCTGCGLSHARSSCPACSVKVAGVAVPTVTVRGTCRETVIFETTGTILEAVMQGRLRYLVQEGGMVRREDGSPVLEEQRTLQTTFAIAGHRTWVARGRRIVAVEHGKVVDMTSTGVDASGRSTFAATDAGLLRTEGDWLLHHDEGRRVGRILDGQTRLWAQGPLAFGAYQAGRLFFGFLLHIGQGGVRDLPRMPIDGRITDVRLYGDDHHALIAIASEAGGKVTHSLFLYDARGQLLGSLSGAPDDHPALATLGGKAVAGGKVLSASPEGLVLLSAARGRSGAGPRLHLTKTFPDSRDFVVGDVELQPGPGGTVYVVTPGLITQLSLGPSS